MKKSKFFILLLVALMCFVAVFFVACDGDDGTEDNKSYVCDEHDWVLKGYISYDSHLYKCKNCYIVKVEEHTTIEKKGDDKHWKECTVCDGQIDLENHNWVYENDSVNHWGECEKCGHTKSSTAHNFVLNKDSNNHWQECDSCKLKKDISKHTVESKIYYDSTNHWQICSICGEKQNTQTHNIIDGKCECGFVYGTQGLHYVYHGEKSCSVYSIGTCEDTNIVIPNMVDNRVVIGIREGAFKACNNIVSITIPSTVTTIGKDAFMGCSSLSKITIPNSITSIADGVFDGCSNLTEIVLPNSVTEIGKNIFRNCSKLNNIILPDNLTIIKYGMFDGCKSLTEFDISDKITEIEKLAFAGSGLNSITIPNTVVNLGGCFYGCTELESVILPGNITFIDEYMFKDCTNLKSITLPENLLKIGRNAFENCTSLEQTLGLDKVTIIERTAFKNCALIKKIVLSEKLNIIEDEVFRQCAQLSELNLPDSVTSIGVDAFKGSGLKNITLPNSLKEIKNNAFTACMDLTSVVIPNSVTSIGDEVFSVCENLFEITIPLTVKNIGSMIVFGNEKTVIYCEADSKLDGWADNWSNVNCGGGGTVVWSYKQNDIANDGYIYTIVDGLRYSIKDNQATVVKQSSNLSGNITIPASINYKGQNYDVTQIGVSAFAYRSGITGISIPHTVNSIVNRAFLCCVNIESITVDENNEYYKSENNCLLNKSGTKLLVASKNCVIPDSVTVIEAYAFYYFKELTSIVIPDSVGMIWQGAFERCENLQSVTMSANLEILGPNVFSGCKKLESLTLPASLKNIYDDAFVSCTNLKTINFTGSMQQWPNIEKSENYLLYSPDFVIVCTDGKLDKEGNVLETYV